MLKWFRSLKRPPAAPAERDSLFSNGTPAPEVANPFAYADAFAKSFQRTAADLRPTNRAGQPVGAMDAAPVTDGGAALATFAMDAATSPQSFNGELQPAYNLPIIQFDWYASQGFIGYQVCSLISQHWLIDKILTMPARDAMRHGYEIGTSDDDEIDPKVLAFIKKRDKAFGIKDACVEFVRFNRMFGIRIAMPVIDTTDPEFYVKPFNIDGVKPGSYRGISQIDPYWITPELDFQAGANPASINFYEPTWWRINGQRIHRSHLIIIRNGQVADVLKPSYLYGGISVPQKIALRVYAAERTANEAPQLALSKRTSLWKMDMKQALANQALFEQKMAWFAATRDNFGIKAIGLQDEVEQLDTSLTDFDAVINQQYAIVCAAGDCPVNKILGTAESGLGGGAAGSYDEKSYHEFLESIQTNECQPLIERHHLLLMKSEVIPKFGTDFETEIVWNPTDSPSAKELADLNNMKATTAKTYADAGAVDGQDIRTVLVADKYGGYTALEDELPEMPDENPESNAGGGNAKES